MKECVGHEAHMLGDVPLRESSRYSTHMLSTIKARTNEEEAAVRPM
jgi:hypothetical protein